MLMKLLPTFPHSSPGKTAVKFLKNWYPTCLSLWSTTVYIYLQYNN